MFCDIIKVLIAVAIPNAGGIAGSILFGPRTDSWFDDLVKPDLQPPDWVFIPVWTTLYTLMGIASYLVYRNGGGFTGNAQVPLIIYVASLIFNWGWSPVFFGMRDIFGALLIIIALTTCATICGIAFAKINRIAGLLFIPYLIWLTLATYLNYSTLLLNPDKIKYIQL